MSNTVTDSGTPDYPPHWILDTPLCHQPARKEEGEPAALTMDLPQPDPKAKQVALDEFILEQAIRIHTHMETLADTPGKVPRISNSAFELIE